MQVEERIAYILRNILVKVKQQLQDKEAIMLYIFYLKSKILQQLSYSLYLSFIDNLWWELMHNIMAYFRTINIQAFKRVEDILQCSVIIII